MTKRYQRSFIEFVLNQVLHKKDRTIAEIARENNIADTTIHYWLKTFGDKPINKKKQISEQYKILCEYNSLNAEERGKYLRLNGLLSTELKQWENEIMSSLDKNEKEKPTFDKEKKALVDRIKLLEKELNNKNAVIAELTTISILKKKAEEMGVQWHFNEEHVEQLKKKNGL